jgi:hypothetical protein
VAALRPLFVLLSLATLLALALSAGGAAQDAPPPACEAVSPDAGNALIGAYASQDGYAARQRGDRVSVTIPPIAFTAPDGSTSSTLPAGPCQTIYRFRYPTVTTRRRRAPSPFRYVEIDWNTEGRPRGPNGSFASGHFDFHFYVRSRAYVDDATSCDTGGANTCDPILTGERKMRRFLRLPSPRFLPTDYVLDPGSSIPAMGLHHLDQRFTYAKDYVDHHPVLLYGSFDGRLLFAEASVTLPTLHDVTRDVDRTISFPFRQPHAVRGGHRWPRRFALRMLPDGGFEASFIGLHRIGRR